MNTKIPPPLQILIVVLLMWGSSYLLTTGGFDFQGQAYVAGLFAVCGVVILVIAIFSFREAQTTVNPLDPSETTKLVVAGLYKFTRNPMYLGQLLLLTGIAIWLGNIFNVLLLLLFVWYITLFQIKPEEEALEKIFNDDYRAYKNRVRRWL